MRALLCTCGLGIGRMYIIVSSYTELYYTHVVMILLLWWVASVQLSATSCRVLRPSANAAGSLGRSSSGRTVLPAC